MSADIPVDVAVLGAGPAGLAAAAAAADAGSRVALIDASVLVGGQYWRHRPADTGGVRHDRAVFLRLQRSVTEHADTVQHLAQASIWRAESLGEHGFAVYATVAGRAVALRARSVVVATGAYDRQLPFPGWTLPGVFTAGAAQALLTGHGVMAGSRVVVAGTGPFLLVVAAGLADAGAHVAGVYEAAAGPWAFARHPVAVARNPGKLLEGTRLATTLARHRIPYHTRSAVVAAHGTDSVTGATVARLDHQWKVVPGTSRRVECDTVAVGYGFTPQLELAVQLGCATRLDIDGNLVVDVDERQRSSVAGVYVAGEATGVGGAALSVVEGEIAGRCAVAGLAGDEPDAGVLRGLGRRRAAARRFAVAVQRGYPIRRGWMSWSDEHTVVCRCEEVTTGEIRHAIADLGASDPRAVKMYARPGMGLCQGKVCGYAVSAMASAAGDREPTVADLRGIAGRPIAQPVTLGDVAAGPILDAGTGQR